MSWQLDKEGDKIGDFFIGMRPHVRRFFRFKWGDITHSFTNLFVEAARLSPYHQGHIVQWIILIQTAIIIILVILYFFS